MEDAEKLSVEALEARFELAAVAAAEGDTDTDSCSGSCCMTCMPPDWP